MPGSGGHVLREGVLIGSHSSHSVPASPGLPVGSTADTPAVGPTADSSSPKAPNPSLSALFTVVFIVQM